LTEKFLISIAIPVKNEVDNLDMLYARLLNLSSDIDEFEFEFVFSDNSSTDGTWEKIRNLAASDRRIKGIRFSKDIGFQRSILANYAVTNGNLVMQLDADLQDPPELLREFIDQWNQGYKVVYGIRKERPENFFLRKFRKFGYFLIDWLSETSIPRNAGDFRLLDRSVVDLLSQNKSGEPYIRGMIANLGFKQTGIEYSREERKAGNSKFNLSKLIKLGLVAVFNHSTMPLRLASYLGMAILFLSTIYGSYVFYSWNQNLNLPKGYTSLTLILLFGIGLISFLLGIIGEYIYRIYLMVAGEPKTIIQDYLNLDKKPEDKNCEEAQ